VTPLVRGLTGTAHGDLPQPPAAPWSARTGDHDEGDAVADQSMSTSMTADTSTAEDELPEPGTTRSLLAKFQSLQSTSE